VSQELPLGPDDVGRRISLRHRVGTRDGRPLRTDVVGVVEAVDDDVVHVRRRAGSVASIPVDTITAVRRVSDEAVRRPRRAQSWSAVALEEVAWAGWPGLEQEHLGAWVLRAAKGFTGRANSVLPLGDPGLELELALDHVAAFYRHRGQPTIFQLPMPLAASLDDLLAERGWRRHNPVAVMVADLEAVLTATPHADGLPPLTMTRTPDEAWLAAYHYRGGALPAHAVEVLTAGTSPVFASVRGDDGAILAIARGALSEGWIGVTAVEVAETQRRRGLGTHVMRELLAWAAREGNRHAYLQVARENDAALALYSRMGFDEHHDYHYRLEPTPDASPAHSIEAQL
jgi:N-acetylglutamate synthase